MTAVRCLTVAAASLTVVTTGALAQIRTLPPGSNTRVATIPKPATRTYPCPPGQYALTLTVTSVDGQSVSRQFTNAVSVTYSGGSMFVTAGNKRLSGQANGASFSVPGQSSSSTMTLTGSADPASGGAVGTFVMTAGSHRAAGDFTLDKPHPVANAQKLKEYTPPSHNTGGTQPGSQDNGGGSGESSILSQIYDLVSGWLGGGSTGSSTPDGGTSHDHDGANP